VWSSICKNKIKRKIKKEERKKEGERKRREEKRKKKVFLDPWNPLPSRCPARFGPL